MKTVRKPLSRERLITEVEGESMTDTSFGNDTDVNHIVARFTRTGILPTPTRQPQYADVSNLQNLSLTEHLQNARELTRQLAENKNERARLEKAEQENYARWKAEKAREQTVETPAAPAAGTQPES